MGALAAGACKLADTRLDHEIRNRPAFGDPYTWAGLGCRLSKVSGRQGSCTSTAQSHYQGLPEVTPFPHQARSAEAFFERLTSAEYGSFSLAVNLVTQPNSGLPRYVPDSTCNQDNADKR
jgi:hypothetical protein